MLHRLKEIERLRPLRARRDGFAPLGERIEARRRDLERTAARLGPVVAAWETVITPNLVEQTRLRSIRSGVLGVDVASSGALYEVDRVLRSGGSDELKRLTSGAVRQVRLHVAATSDDSAHAPRFGATT